MILWGSEANQRTYFISTHTHIYIYTGNKYLNKMEKKRINKYESDAIYGGEEIR